MYRNAMDEKPERLEWHPAIRALGWVLGWGVSAFCAGAVSEFLAKKRSEISWSGTMARGVVAVGAVGLAAPVVLACETWWRIVARARREYDGAIAKQFILIASSAAGLGLALYTPLAVWLLRRAWRRTEPWSRSLGGEDSEPREKPGWKMTLALIAGSAFLARFTVRVVYYSVRNYAACARVLGRRRVLRGMAMMLLLRLRQPRRDFFIMTPVIGDMRQLALAVLAYAVIPSRALAAAIGSMMALVDIAITLDRIRPPTWLFLGASDFDSFAAFYNLRHHAWGVTAVTLLDRTSDQGRSFYEAERTVWSRTGWNPKGLFYDPTIPRIWSLRTRPQLWDHSVVLLIDYVPRVVVDVRRVSEYVQHEILYLVESDQIDKAWFIAGEDGLTPALAELIPPSAHARVMTAEALIRIEGPESDRAPRPARPDRSPTPGPP